MRGARPALRPGLVARVSGLTIPSRGWAPRLASAGALVLVLAVLLPLLLIAGRVAEQHHSPGLPDGVDGIPAIYLPLYRAAGEAFGVHWLLLASIHAQETRFSTFDGPGVRSGTNGCGAAGPMQFGIVGVAPYRAAAPSCGALTGTGAGGTWARYADAARRLPDRVRAASSPPPGLSASGAAVPPSTGCVYADADSIAAAAAYLHDLGARDLLDARAWEAAHRYNGAAAYAD